MLSEQNMNDINLTNAKSSLSISTTKNYNKNNKSSKNLMDIEEYGHRDPLNSGITKYTDELNRIVSKVDKSRSKSKQNKNTNLNTSKNEENESWLETSFNNTENDQTFKYEKYLNAFTKMCSDRDLENQFLIDI